MVMLAHMQHTMVDGVSGGWSQPAITHPPPVLYLDLARCPAQNIKLLSPKKRQILNAVTHMPYNTPA